MSAEGLQLPSSDSSTPERSVSLHLADALLDEAQAAVDSAVEAVPDA